MDSKGITMKKLSTYLFLIFFSFSAPSFADDIRDFQIEGMSVGDSLLNHFSEKKIIQEINSKWSLDYGNKFIQIGVGEGKNYSLSKKIEIYDSVSVVLKLNDKNYIIYSLAGRITCKPLEECHTIKKNIVSDLENVLTYKKRDTGENIHPEDKSGKSKTYTTDFFSKSYDERIVVEFYDWSEEILKEKHWEDNVKVIIHSKEFDDFLSEYFN